MRGLRSLIIGYFLIVIVLAFLQRKLLFPASTAEALPVAADEVLTETFPAAKDVALTTEDGVTIRGWLLRKNDAPDRPLVVFFHGNGGHRAWRGPWYNLLDSIDADVLAIDYHGYGDSEGKPSEGNIEQDCRATLAYVIDDLGYPPGEVYIMGMSLGGAAAIYSTEYLCKAGTPPKGLITVSTFSSAVSAAKAIYWWLPVEAVMIDRFPSSSRIGNVTCPILMLHGNKDKIVGYNLGERLFAAAPEESSNGTPKRWVRLEAAGHNNLPGFALPTFRQELGNFIKKNAK